MTSWIVFGLIIISLIIFDLGVFAKGDREISFRKSIYLSLIYITIAIIFGLWLYYWRGSARGEEYFTGYFVEKAMAMDNIFIISMIFKFFGIPAKYKHRVLMYGILGVIIMRGAMIGGGIVLITKYHWVIYFAALILIYTGVKALYLSDTHKIDIKEMIIYKMMVKIFNVHPKIEGNKFFIFKKSKLYVTPLFMALVTIEIIDVVFAIDSLPAIFAITQDPFVIYTSNLFAILGLRALFFCLEGVVEKFRYLKYSLALILILIGLKIFANSIYKVEPIIPLVGTILLLAGGVIASIIKKKA